MGGQGGAAGGLAALANGCGCCREGWEMARTHGGVLLKSRAGGGHFCNPERAVGEFRAPGFELGEAVGDARIAAGHAVRGGLGECLVSPTVVGAWPLASVVPRAALLEPGPSCRRRPTPVTKALPPFAFSARHHCAPQIKLREIT